MWDLELCRLKGFRALQSTQANQMELKSYDDSGHYIIASQPPKGDQLQRRRPC